LGELINLATGARTQPNPILDGIVVISPQAVTKIVLPSRSRLLIHRSRLVDFLNENIQRRLVLLSASTGYGKTSLLVDFAHVTTLPVCWYSLETFDRDQQVFLEYLIASIQRRFPKVGERAQAVLSCGRSSWEAVIGALSAEIQDHVPDPFVIILDDYYAVADSDVVNQILDEFIFRVPQKAHLILSARALPTKLALARLAIRQELATLKDSDLRFTAEETQTLVRKNFHVELSLPEADKWVEHSEGWIAGLLLTTSAPSSRVFPQANQDQTAQENLFSFLASETFEDLAPDLQRFLLDSSIFDQFDVAICDAVLDVENSTEFLRRIEDQNLFVVRLGEADGLRYRYHHLFREFLRRRLMETNPSRWRELNRRAARFFETRGTDAGQPITHYLAAEMYREAVRLIERTAQATFDAGQYTSLASWIDGLPSDIVEAYPSLVVMRGMVYAETGESAMAETAYGRAIQTYQSQGDGVAAAKVMVWRAMLWQLQGRYREAIESCEQVLETLHDHNARWEEARAYRVIGTAHLRLGEFPGCVRELGKALALYEALGDELRVAWLHHDIGTCLRTHGDARAERHYEKALAFWRRTHNVVGLAMTLNSIGVGYHLAGDYGRAIAALEESRMLARQIGNRRNEAFSLTSLGDVYRDQGEYTRALEVYRGATEIGRHVDGFIRVYALVALGETYRLLDDLAKAERYLREALDEAQSHESIHEIGLAETALGIWRCQEGQVEEALVHLTRATELLKPMPRDWARARLHLARAYFLGRKYGAAKRQLEVVVDADGVEALSIPFVVADRKQLLPLIKYAATHNIGRRYFRPALQKLSALEKTAKAAAPSSPPRLRVYAFGTTQVMLGEKLITREDWKMDSAKDLFFLLLAHPEGLRRDKILEALWSDRPASKASVIFHSTAYLLRKTIPRCVVYEGGVYHLRQDLALESDVTEFEELIQRAETAAVETERIESYMAALAVYRGDYFEESYQDWCVEIRTRLQRKYLDALFALAGIYERRSEFDQALAHYQTLIDKDRDREEVYLALMRLQYQTGNRVAAVKTYQRWIQVLRDELNISEPSREIRELYERIVKDQGEASPAP